MGWEVGKQEGGKETHFFPACHVTFSSSAMLISKGMEH